MNGIVENAPETLREPGSPDETQAARSPRNLPCFHCGEPCGNGPVASGKAFCCEGCRLVHDLLCTNGLDQFYALDSHPGVRMRDIPAADQWTFLDEPAVSRRLLDFEDGSQSRITLHIPAIHCIACVWLLENLFRLHSGIGKSEVNFSRRQLAVTFAPERIKLSQLVALLASIGYEAALNLGELDKPVSTPSRHQPWLQVGVAGFAFGNIMLLSIPQYFGMDSFSTPGLKPWFGGLSLALALPAVVFSASDYWKSAWLAVRRRIVTLDVPIALGLAAIYLQSAFEILSGTGEGYCDSLTGLIFFLLCGRAFQHKTQEWLTFDRDYRSFFPLSVCRRTTAPGGKTVERVALDHLQVGDRIQVRNREIIPADATVLSGEALIDYSFVTGESQPVARRVGDYVFAGGQQLGATIELKTVKPVSQSYLTSLWNHESFRKNRGDDLQSLTNRYSQRFTAIVVAVAVGSAAFWIFLGDPARALKAFVSVLIVACPCALALAAPFTLGTALRWLARRSVFLKNTLALERMAHVDTIVFDKTGTLTSSGAGSVTFHADAAADKQALSVEEEAWIGSVCRHSTHPHSASIARAFDAAQSAHCVTGFSETTGHGVAARVNGRPVVLGSTRWLRDRGVMLPQFDSAMENGAVVHVGIDDVYRGTFALSNPLRAEVQSVLAALGRQYELTLLSGDNERDRERFLALFGTGTRLNFNQRPIDKLNFIRNLQEKGRTVMMVGDGLNDAGALRQSDVGVAVVEEVGSFSPASDVILSATKIRELENILDLARKATKIVRISFGISAAYNVVGVSIAAAGLLSPLVCAILMPVSSVSVVVFACGVTAWAARRSGFESIPDRERSRPDHLLKYQPA